MIIIFPKTCEAKINNINKALKKLLTLLIRRMRTPYKPVKINGRQYSL